MKDNERDGKYKKMWKRVEEDPSSGNSTPEDATAAHRTQQGQTRKSATLPMPSRFGPVLRQRFAHLSEHPVSHTPSSRKPGMYLSLKRKTVKKRRQRRMTVIAVIPAAVLILSVLLIVKSCGGGDVLKGTWDLDGVTVYQFDGTGHGSLNLPSNTYPFTYEIKDNELRIDFESDAARDAAYTFTVEKDKLILKYVEKGREKTYELTKEGAK